MLKPPFIWIYTSNNCTSGHQFLHRHRTFLHKFDTSPREQQAPATQDWAPGGFVYLVIRLLCVIVDGPVGWFIGGRATSLAGRCRHRGQYSMGTVAELRAGIWFTEAMGLAYWLLAMFEPLWS